MTYYGFDIREYVPKSVWDVWGEKSIRFIDERLVMADAELKKELSEHFGEEIVVTINNWHYGGTFDDRGFRSPESSVGKWTSAHRQGRGSDHSFKLKSTGMPISIKEVYDFIMANEEYWYDLGIRRIENIKYTQTWLHWDTTWTTMPHGKIQIVDP